MKKDNPPSEPIDEERKEYTTHKGAYGVSLVFPWFKQECPVCGAKPEKGEDKETIICHKDECRLIPYLLFVEDAKTVPPDGLTEALYNEHKDELLKTYEETMTSLETICSRHG